MSDMEHATTPQPGDYWHEHFCPVLVVVWADFGNVGFIEKITTTPQGWTWNVSVDSIMFVTRKEFRKRLEYESLPGTFWCRCIPGHHTWVVDELRRQTNQMGMKVPKAPELRSEEGAEITTATGWACTRCKRFWGDRVDSERMARYCCSNSFPCDCGGRHDKPHTKCSDCIRKRAEATWAAQPMVAWDGEWPIAEWDDDTYYFSEDDLEEEFSECEEGLSYSEWMATKKLVSCRPQRPRTFDVNEWCCDELGEDLEIADAKDIDARINAILDEIGIVSWIATGTRLSIASLTQ